MPAHHAIRAILIGCLLVLTAACDGVGGGRYGASDDHYEVDGDADARDEAADDARQEIYSEFGADSDGTDADVSRVNAYSVEDSGNFFCTDDCSGHEAGFAWAQENDIEDAEECGGHSISFTEGCETFAQELQKAADMETQELAEQAAEEAYESYEHEDYEEEGDHHGRMIDGRY